MSQPLQPVTQLMQGTDEGCNALLVTAGRQCEASDADPWHWTWAPHLEKAAYPLASGSW
jgi:hypothetical protein